MTPLDDRDPVDVLAEDFADRLRRGEHPSVSDYAAANPTHADQLRELLPAVAQMEYLKRFRRATGMESEPQLPDQFGDFRIVRELGRGGMGVVFEAVQESLGRPVALKVLAAHAQLDDVRQERFIREAHAAARLHHTNIVPVFGVGEQDGMPYYVMQLIRGLSLNAVVRRWQRERGDVDHDAPTTVGQRKTVPLAAPGRPAEQIPIPKYGDWAFVAESGVQAAEALHYAHKQGVLHRDVKPANLLLDPSGRVWVTDFGLAKLVDLNGLTASGDILGTLQYLAPECLAGDSDPRSDVYGLGATLYELLTLVPPYPSDSPARLLKQVADADPEPPRQLNPNIPRDLETIVLKAMAREPERRYLSARELARDLQAFLEDRPIKARRQTWYGRAWRWCRRNPAIAVLSANVVAALFLAAVVGWVGYAKTKRALAAEETRLKEAEKARADADQARYEAEQASAKLEANLRLSLEAFEGVFDAAGGNRQGFGMRGRPGGPGGPGGGPGGPPPGMVGDAADKAAVLEAVLAFYDKFAVQNATNPKLQFEAAKAHRRVGEARVWLGQTDKATTCFRRSIGLLEHLHGRYPANELYGSELVQAYLNAPLDAIGPDEEKTLERILKLARGLETNQRPYLSGSVWLKVGWVRDRTGNRVAAEEAYREAIASLSSTQGEDVRQPPLTELTLAKYYLAVLLAETKRLPEARRILDEVTSEWRRTHDRGPGSRPPREVVTTVFQQLADVCERLGDRRAANEAKFEASRQMGMGGPGGPGGGPGGPGGPGGGPGGPKGPKGLNPPPKN